MKDLLLNHFQEHKGEVILVAVSCMCTVVASVAFYGSSRGKEEPVKVVHGQELVEKVVEKKIPITKDTAIYVDVSGAVLNPGMIKLAEGDRLSEAIDKAGGLSSSADTDFFARNYNSSRILYDQEKIYVPRIDEISQGIFVEGSYLINHSLERVNGVEKTVEGTSDGSETIPTTSGSKINVNSASEAELDTLPGIGPATAQKIIDQRPYASIDELLEKKSVSQSVYDKISNLVSAN